MDAHRCASVVLSAAACQMVADPVGRAQELAGDFEAVAHSLLDPWLAGGGSVLWPDDPGWPTGFAALGHAAPLMLWVRGHVPENPADCVAIVGSRSCTSYGVEASRALAGLSAGLERSVVSGGARGIDAAAHEGALQAGGHTVLVAAGGAGHVYPGQHADLFVRVASRGGVVWEFPPGVRLTAAGFLTRNRLIAAMAATTVVVEAAERSGALNTGRTAADLGRLVLAVPGPITSRMSTGCHRAIADGWAAILLGPADLRQMVAPVPV